MKQSNTAQELLNMAKQLTDDSKKQIKKVDQMTESAFSLVQGVMEELPEEQKEKHQDVLNECLKLIKDSRNLPINEVLERAEKLKEYGRNINT